MIIKKYISLVIAICIILTSFAVQGTQSDFATRGDVADMLLEAADFYNPGVERSDIIKGYEDGSIHEEWSVTRAEALVMLKRAFGELPLPLGHNARVSLKAGDFNDIPAWAQTELGSVFDSGIVAGTGKGTFSPEAYVTKEQMQLFINRVYALFAGNPKDDFYAAVNKDLLDSMQIPDGEFIEGTVYNLQTLASTQLDGIIQDIVHAEHKKGTAGRKMKDLYNCIIDTKSINKASVEPIKKYLDMIDSVKNIGELSRLQTLLAEELCVNVFARFDLAVDLADSSRYILCFQTMQPLMNKELYLEEDSSRREIYLEYLETLLTLGGEDSQTAAENAKAYFSLEKSLAEDMLDSQERNDVENYYNIFTFNKLSVMLPDSNLEEILASSMLQKEERVMVFDPGITMKFAEVYNQSNIDVLKIAAKIKLLSVWGEVLDTRIEEAGEKLDNQIFGTTGSYTRKQKASLILQNTMPEYLGKMYVEKYFDEKSKNDVMNMVKDIIAVFKERINKLDWMSDTTKEKAVRKLDTMKIEIGYPDSFESFVDNVEIRSADEGGSYFSNMLAIAKESVKYYASLQNMPADNSAWQIYPYIANAGYNVSGNSITFPAAILQSPLYDPDASYEENLGGIGYIIAHEITHAFDNNGALFDENGNVSDWWTQNDYKQFKQLCERVVEFFDGYEAIPAVPTNGTLTLGENVADLGAAACITELAAKKGEPDYKRLYSSMARTFANTTTREYAKYAMQYDTHADGKARVNLIVVHFDEFYQAFDIGEGDGMYVPPEERITIW